jgi:hypothetical protein
MSLLVLDRKGRGNCEPAFITMFTKGIRYVGQLGTGERCVDVSARQVKQVHQEIAVQAKTTFGNFVVFFISQIYCPTGSVEGPWKYDNQTRLMHHQKLDK